MIVAAGSAYDLYRKYSMYFCQPGRTFQPVERIGFYAGNEIKIHVPRVLVRRDNVGINRTSAQALRRSTSQDDVTIGHLVERLLDDGVLRDGDVQQVFLLSPGDDPNTLVLPRPIRNVSLGPRGQRVAWTQKQRYVSFVALEQAPETTAGLSPPHTHPDDPTVKTSSSGPQHQQREGRTPWYQEIRDIHDRHFGDPWQERIDSINQRYALTGPQKFFTPDPDAPIPWFNGNIEAVEPGRWVLVISLNHFVNPETRKALNLAPSPSYTPDAFWHHRRTFNTEFWYRKFFGPLARVAAAAFGEQLIREEESHFATHRMIFTEICPYGSQRFSLSWPDVAELLKTDVGFQCAAAVNRVLVEWGRPALVMVNGLRSIDMFAHVYAGALTWQQSRYHSCDLPQEGRKHKQLTHYCGSLNLGHSVVPVVGFPFLRNPAAHNSNAELALLASHVRQCVVDQAAVATHVSA